MSELDILANLTGTYVLGESDKQFSLVLFLSFSSTGKHRYDFRMMPQNAFYKPAEAELLQRGTKMTNRGIIYSLFDGLKKIKLGYFSYRLYFSSLLRGSEKYLHELHFVEETIRAYCTSHHKIKCCMYSSLEHAIETP